MHKLKKLTAAAVPALALLFATASNAQVAGDPECYTPDSLVQALKDQAGEVPTGDIARDKGPWATLEMYADPADGSWSLVGKPSEEGLRQLGIAPGTDARCLLLGGADGFDAARRHPALIHLFGPPRTPAPAP